MCGRRYWNKVARVIAFDDGTWTVASTHKCEEQNLFTALARTYPSFVPSWCALPQEVFSTDRVQRFGKYA